MAGRMGQEDVLYMKNVSLIPFPIQYWEEHHYQTNKRIHYVQKNLLIFLQEYPTNLPLNNNSNYHFLNQFKR